LTQRVRQGYDSQVMGDPLCKRIVKSLLSSSLNIK
jgi:hypothetical protein